MLRLELLCMDYLLDGCGWFEGLSSTVLSVEEVAAGKGVPGLVMLTAAGPSCPAAL